LDVGVLRRQHDVADFQSVGRKNVALLAVPVLQESDVGRAVRIVFDRRHGGRHTQLVTPPIDHAIAALVAAAAETRGDATVVVASAGRLLGLDERLLRLVSLGKLREIEAHHAASPGRSWLIRFETHGSYALKEIDRSALR